jgi:deazaflavin-dependent oxidoreductase (nitroreductase family)
MPLPRKVAEFNRVATNRLTGLFAGWLPPLLIVEHRGRRSGRPYRTPLLGFPADNEMIIALTYGPGAEWIKNLQRTGGGTLVARNRRRAFGPPRLDRGIMTAPGIPWPIRRFLALVGVDEYLRLPLLSTGMRRGQTDA